MLTAFVAGTFIQQSWISSASYTNMLRVSRRRLPVSMMF